MLIYGTFNDITLFIGSMKREKVKQDNSDQRKKQLRIRKEKLAQALRENLLKRKEQMRARLELKKDKD